MVNTGSSTGEGSGPRGAGLALLHLAFLATIGLHVLIPFLLPDGVESDFGIFYGSAVEVRRGGNPYERPAPASAEGTAGEPARGVPEGLETPEWMGNLNPPFQTAIMAPLGRLPYAVAMWLWYGLGLAAGIAAGFLVARTWLPGRPLRVWGPLSAMAVLLFYPSLVNAWFQQFGLFLALAAAFVFWLVERRRLATAGLVLGVGTGVKLFLGLFGALFLLTRRRRALGGLVLGFTATVAAAGVALGWHTYGEYVRMLARVDWHAASLNASVFGAVTRLLGSDTNPGVVPGLARFGLPAARAVALLLGLGYAALLLALRRRLGSRETLRLGVSLTFVSMILLSPLGWLYYLPALLPSCAALLATAAPGRERAVCVAGVGAFLLLSSIPQRLYAGSQFGAEGYDWWKSEASVAALLILGGVHVWLLWRKAGEREAPMGGANGAGGLPGRPAWGRNP